MSPPLFPFESILRCSLSALLVLQSCLFGNCCCAAVGCCTDKGLPNGCVSAELADDCGIVADSKQGDSKQVDNRQVDNRQVDNRQVDNRQGTGNEQEKGNSQRSGHSKGAPYCCSQNQCSSGIQLEAPGYSAAAVDSVDEMGVSQLRTGTDAGTFRCCSCSLLPTNSEATALTGNEVIKPRVRSPFLAPDIRDFPNAGERSAGFQQSSAPFTLSVSQRQAMLCVWQN